MEPSVATADEVEPDLLKAGEELAHRCRREHVKVRRIVLGRSAEQEAKPTLEPIRIRNGSHEHGTGPENTVDLTRKRVGELEVLEELSGNDHVEARALEGKRLLDVRLNRLDPERLGLGERCSIDVETDNLVAVEEVTGQRPRATAEIENPLPAPDRRLEERDPLGHEDELAFGTSLAVMLLVAVGELVGHAEPTAASCPSEAIVRRRPSSSATSGSHPRICLARVMSGCRT